MILRFSPHKEFLTPYTEAAGRLASLSDEFFDHLEATLTDRQMQTGRILATRTASRSLDTTRPLALIADFDERLGGADLLVETVRVLPLEESG